MSRPASRITDLEVIPLAFSDPPLLNAAGVHEPLALRTLVRLEIGDVVAWGEGRGDALPPDVVPALDAQGKLLGRPVSELLGGALRDRVDYSAYLFFKWSGHIGAADDEWGE